MSESKFLALDFGAESGRAILGILNDQKIELYEVHRFPNKISHLFRETEKRVRLEGENNNFSKKLILATLGGTPWGGSGFRRRPPPQKHHFLTMRMTYELGFIGKSSHRYRK